MTKMIYAHIGYPLDAPVVAEAQPTPNQQASLRELLQAKINRTEVEQYIRDTHYATATEDKVNSPSHYKSEGGIECIEAIRSALTPEEFRGYCKGNILKYTWRERKKGGDESLAKAQWYMKALLDDSHNQ